MKKQMLTKESYLPLAEKTWEFMVKQIPAEPTVMDLAACLGALEAIKFGVIKQLKELGHDMQVIDMGDTQQ